MCVDELNDAFCWEMYVWEPEPARSSGQNSNLFFKHW